jgi:hypothetical protein
MDHWADLDAPTCRMLSVRTPYSYCKRAREPEPRAADAVAHVHLLVMCPRQQLGSMSPRMQARCSSECISVPVRIGLDHVPNTWTGATDWKAYSIQGDLCAIF